MGEVCGRGAQNTKGCNAKLDKNEDGPRSRKFRNFSTKAERIIATCQTPVGLPV